MTTFARFVLPALLLAASPVIAQTRPPAPASMRASTMPDWDHLTPAQRDALVAPIRERWNANPAMRGRMWGHADRWRTMTPDQRAQARRGMERFEGMSPAERAEARGAFERFRQLPPEQREALRAKLRAMTPEQRRAWLQAQSQARD